MTNVIVTVTLKKDKRKEAGFQYVHEDSSKPSTHSTCLEEERTVRGQEPALPCPASESLGCWAPDSISSSGHVWGSEV